MTKEQKDTMTVRVTSVGFAILVFALFRPLGMGDDIHIENASARFVSQGLTSAFISFVFHI